MHLGPLLQRVAIDPINHNYGKPATATFKMHVFSKYFQDMMYIPTFIIVLTIQDAPPCFQKDIVHISCKNPQISRDI